MVSRLEKEKNVALGLEAFKLILGKIPEAGLVIVGSGKEEKRLKEQVKNLGIEMSVIFEGWQNQAEIASYYKTCDCFLVTSWYEGYGMTLVEAQAAGAKIVSTDVGVAREMEAEIASFEPRRLADAILKGWKI